MKLYVNRSRHYSILVVLLLAAAACSSPDRSAYLEGYESRRHSLISYYADAEPSRSYTILTAKLLRGTDIDASLTYLDTLFAAPSGDMFWMYSSLGMYLYGKKNLPAEYRDAYRELWRTYTPYRGDTENHWVMYYTTLYLAAQEWPSDPEETWFTGKTSLENLTEAGEWLNVWMDITTSIGQGEFDSPHYMSVFLAPMFLLYEFSKDTGMRTKAGMMLDYLLADFAAEYLRGNYCGAHSRDMIPTVTDPLRAAMTSFGWLFFGDTGFVPRGETLLAALSSYKLPQVIYHIATDRDEPYVHIERKRVRNVIRYGTELNPPVYKYLYMTKDYALGSLHGGIAQPIQQHTWDVTFVSDEPNNSLFSIHPYYSEREVGMFFPEPLKILVDGIGGVRPKYPDPDKWVGSSPYTGTFQYKNSIIVLYDIPEGTTHEQINGFFPKTLKERHIDPGGWIFCHGGNTYIAYFPLQNYHWIDEESNWRLRSYERRNGLVLEVASADEYPSFEEFQTAIRANRMDLTEFEPSGRVIYTTTSGNVMEFSFAGERFLNGERIRLEDYKLFDSKFLQSEVGGKKLTLSARGISRELDFNRVKIRERR